MSRGKESEKHGFLITTWVVIAISIIYILIGLLLLLVPGANLVYLFYAIAAILLIFGIALIVRYLISQAYHNIGNYSFSVGISCILVGICVLIRASVLSAYLPLFLGICILFGAMIKLQNATDLHCVESKAWIVFLILAFAFVAAAFMIILNPFTWLDKYPDAIYYILIADGAVGIVGTCYVGVSIRLFFKHERRRKEKAVREKEQEIEERASKKAEEKYQSLRGLEHHDDEAADAMQEQTEKDPEQHVSIDETTEDIWDLNEDEKNGDA